MKFLFPFFFLFLLTTPLVSSHENNIDAGQKYQELTQQWESFKNRHGLALIRLFEDTQNKRNQSLKKSQRKLKTEYKNLKSSLLFWHQTAKLKQDLLTLYQTYYPLAFQDELRAAGNEANLLAINLIQGIKRLQKEYGIHTFPITHNLLIDLKIKKRGACKHWAEDLLNIINGINHPHFTSYWGEAHPGNILEHNVAVLTPFGASFKDGLIIDPWRTAGKPFWIKVKEDGHPWHAWIGYVPR